MSSLSGNWSILPFANRDRGPPKLLFKFFTNSDGFELYVTDLIRCWADSGTRESVTKQAAVDRSSIDPSEDASQFAVLLSKLRDGLAGQNGGRCKVGPGDCSNTAIDSQGSFSLSLRTPLPAPLRPLHWTFHLRQEGRMLLTRELLLPALAADLKNERQIDELIIKIKEKDHVITRLMDKIEQSSIDLSLVFPGYGTGRKGLNAKQAVKLVPGASKFDEDGWRKKHEDPMLTTTRSASDLLRKPHSDQVSFDSPNDYSNKDPAWGHFGNTRSFSPDWVDPRWDHPTFTEDDVPKHGERKIVQKEPRPTPELRLEESIDAFEVRASLPGHVHRTDPVRRQRPSPEAKLSPNIEQRHEPRKRPRSSQQPDSAFSDDSPPALTASKALRIGGLGGSRSKIDPISRAAIAILRNSTTSSDSDSDSPPHEKKAKKSSKLGNPGGSNKYSISAASRQSSLSSPISTKPSTPSRKLGALGGKKDCTPHSSPPVPPHTQRKTLTPQSTPSRKLGALGGRHKSVMPQKAEGTADPASRRQNRDEDFDATDSPSVSPSPSAARPSNATAKMEYPVPQTSAEPEQEPLTAEEAADRKREELKRTLDAAGSKKKKRKF